MQEKFQANKTLSKGNYQCTLFASLSARMISLDVCPFGLKFFLK